MQRLKMEMQYKKQTAWIDAMKKCHYTERLYFNFSLNNQVRICIHHFHTSTIEIVENGK